METMFAITTISAELLKFKSDIHTLFINSELLINNQPTVIIFVATILLSIYLLY